MAASAVVGLSIIGASSASAASPDPALWYYNLLNVQAAHDAGWTGKGVTIAVIDGEINTAVPALAGADIVTHPAPACYSQSGARVTYSSVSSSLNAFHATNVVSTIVGNGKSYTTANGVLGVAPDAKVLFYTVSPNSTAPNSVGKVTVCYGKNGGLQRTTANVATAIVAAVNSGATIISISVGAAPTESAASAVAYAENRGVVIVGALPDDYNLDAADWPTDANGVIKVQAGGTDGSTLTKNSTTTVTGPGIGIRTQGYIPTNSWTDRSVSDGTSLATPIIAGFLADVKQKYPSATGNQLIQSLIRNTGTKDHTLAYAAGGIGYGNVSLTHMLAADPTTYPDTNPLVQKSPAVGPTPAQIASASGTPHTGSGTATSTPPANPLNKTGSVVPILVGVLVGILVLALIIVLIVILATRRSRAARNSEGKRQTP